MVENFAKANSPPTEQAQHVLARSRSCCHQATTSTVVRWFFRGTASLYIFSILFSRKSRVPLGRGFFVSILIHPQLALFFRRDHFGRSDASLACSFLPQGLFRPFRFIPSLLFSSAGIISSARIHPQLALFFRRDHFGQSDLSLSCSFSPQGLLQLTRFISSLLFFTTGIISDCDDPP